MSNWQQYLSDAKILEIRKVIVDAGFATHPMLDAFLQGIRPQYTATLPSAGLPPSARLYTQLNAMNRVHNLRNGDVPLAQWLRAASALLGELPGGEVLEKALLNVSEGSEVPPPEAVPAGDLSDANLNIEPEAMIAGEDASLEVRYLQDALTATRSVVKLLIRRHVDGQPEALAGDRPRLVNGTGWVIGPNLLITNHHVVNARMKGFLAEPDASEADFRLQAENTRILFDYLEMDKPSAQVDTAPGALLASDKTLDFAILRIPDAAPQRPPLRLRKQPLRKTLDQALGTRVNVLQHPNGDPMRLAFRDNFVVVGDQDNLSYLTDTSTGSSGSPVCDDAWYVAALHCGSRSVSDKNIMIRGRKVKRENFGTAIPTILANLASSHANLYAEIQAGQA